MAEEEERSRYFFVSETLGKGADKPRASQGHRNAHCIYIYVQFGCDIGGIYVYMPVMRVCWLGRFWLASRYIPLTFVDCCINCLFRLLATCYKFNTSDFVIMIS